MTHARAHGDGLWALELPDRAVLQWRRHAQVKNVSHDELGSKVGKIHMKKQDLKQMQARHCTPLPLECPRGSHSEQACRVLSTVAVRCTADAQDEVAEDTQWAQASGRGRRQRRRHGHPPVEEAARLCGRRRWRVSVALRPRLSS